MIILFFIWLFIVGFMIIRYYEQSGYPNKTTLSPLPDVVFESLDPNNICNNKSIEYIGKTGDPFYYVCYGGFPIKFTCLDNYVYHESQHLCIPHLNQCFDKPANYKTK